MCLSPDFMALDNKYHNLKTFDCGKPSMNEFLQKFALKHATKGISKTFVLTEKDRVEEKRKIVAYYTISAATVSREDIPATGLPRYPIPVTLLARLAIDVNFQKKRLGSKTLIYALRHAVKLADAGMPTVGVTLDVLDDEALNFYHSFKFFYEFTNNPMRLYTPRSEIRKL